MNDWVVYKSAKLARPEVAPPCMLIDRILASGFAMAATIYPEVTIWTVASKLVALDASRGGRDHSNHLLMDIYVLLA